MQDIKAIFEDTSLFLKFAHELRSPTYGIIGLSNHLYENWHVLDDGRKQACLAEIANAGNLLNELIDKLVYLVRNDSSKITYSFDRADLLLVAKKAISDSQIFIRDTGLTNLLLKYELEDSEVLIDSFWISQVLTNLINNAINHSGGKNITLAINSEKSGNNEQLVVSVVDDGVGIAGVEAGSVLDPLKLGINKENVAGKGLGLHICKEIVEAHGGTIWAKNNDRAGVTISFTLPKNVEKGD